MDKKRRVINVAGRQVEVVSSVPKASEIMDALKEGKGRQLVLSRPDGSQEVVPANRRIELKEGETLDVIPTYELGTA